MDSLPIKDALGLLAALGDPEKTKALLADLDVREKNTADKVSLVGDMEAKRREATDAMQETHSQRAALAAERGAWEVDSRRWAEATRTKEVELADREKRLAIAQAESKRAADAQWATTAAQNSREHALDRREQALAGKEADYQARTDKLKQLAG